MPHDTDCPYPLRIWTFFEMTQPYQILIRIGGKLWKIFLCVIFLSVAKEGQFCRRCNKSIERNIMADINDPIAIGSHR